MHTPDKKFLPYLLLSFLIFQFVSCNKQSQTAEEASHENWIELFNGENLDNWTVKITHHELGENYANTFRVENGNLINRYDGYEEFGGQFGHIYYEEPFSTYRLIAEYRFPGEQVEGGPGWAFMNNGIMFHSQPPDSVTLDQEFPNSIEFQLLGVEDDSTQRINGNVCTPGTHVVVDGELITDHCISSNGPTNLGNEWVTAELIAYGDSLIQHKINGELVLEYTNPQLDDGTPLTGGYIAVQSESHPTEFRSIRVLNLEGCMDEAASNYKSYYVKSKPSDCVYE
ncbi:MAG: DUF1080 domain-containing protein [Balneolaceae bacterium]|nr:DUF1080 domain-containing protein [Balneolaceae bacterium]